MFRKNSDIVTPNGNKIIWRYMSLDKFFNLIHSKNLYLSKIVNLTDKFEGRLPPNKYFEGIRFSTKDGFIGSELYEKRSKQEFNILYDYGISCWTMSTNENYALWKIYLDNMKSGVALKSTVGRLRKSIKSSENFYIGEVKYGSTFFDIEEPSDLQIICNKKIYYEYENEVRLIVKDSDKKSNQSISLEVNLDILIDEIYISPFTKYWFHEGFKDIIQAFNPAISNKIRISDIRDT